MTPKIGNSVLDTRKSWKLEPAKDADGSVVPVRLPFVVSYSHMRLSFHTYKSTSRPDTSAPSAYPECFCERRLCVFLFDLVSSIFYLLITIRFLISDY